MRLVLAEELGAAVLAVAGAGDQPCTKATSKAIRSRPLKAAHSVFVNKATGPGGPHSLWLLLDQTPLQLWPRYLIAPAA